MRRTIRMGGYLIVLVPDGCYQGGLEHDDALFPMAFVNTSIGGRFPRYLLD